MLIESVALHPVAVPFDQAYRHAIAGAGAAPSIFVVARDDAGHIGVGEIVGGISSVVPATALASALLGVAFDGPTDVVAWVARQLDAGRWAPPILAGVELALLDLAGNGFGLDVATIVDAAPSCEVRAGWVVGPDIPTAELAKRCAVARLAGRRHVKVKVGGPDDAARLGIVSAAFGVTGGLRIDAGGAWTADQALHALAGLTAHRVKSVEQPVPPADVAGLARVRRDSGVRVIAEASVVTPSDLDRLIDADAIDGIYVRVASHGGLIGALRIVQRAWSAGLEIQLGTTFGETGVLSRASEILAASVPVAECLDGLDQHRALLSGDVVIGTTQHGLGVRVDVARLGVWRTAAPVVMP